MSAAVVILPQVWATAESRRCSVEVTRKKGPHRLQLVSRLEQVRASAAPVRRVIPVRPLVDAQERGNFAFYRKYTEGMLLRSMRMSLEAARVPSFMGRAMFRTQVTNYKVQGFDDVVNFVADVDNCVAKLEEEQQRLVRRIGMQQYTLAEAAAMSGVSLRTVIRRYNEALDDLTRMFLERKMMEPLMASHDPRCEA